ncbi:MAG TPA: hypothetical protein VKB80_02510 [Kofleriaceae bacterium]|nr:hypothetical protein [Kofleriaceae bacterium]
MATGVDLRSPVRAARQATRDGTGSAANRRPRVSTRRRALIRARIWLVALLAPLAGCDRSTSPAQRAHAAAAYPAVVASVERDRAALAADLRAARTPADQARVLDRASPALARLLADRILPAWNGTPWSIAGTAVGPGERPVACGYFVSTALEHAGLRVERRLLAQQPAEHIVRSLVPAGRVARFRRVPLDQFLGAVLSGGDGVYLVGLDYHVGFLVVDRGRAYFHHASRRAGEVVREPALLSSALASSSYRVVGKLSGRDLARAWLTGAALPTWFN